jgi:dihydroorotate dehydrogenase (NAD+) catalytic subunit
LYVRKALSSHWMRCTLIDLSVKLAALELKNPVLLASGVWDLPYTEIIDFNKLGGVICKGVSLNPKEGNPPPRIAETPCGVINSIGLENKGLEHFTEEILTEVKKLKTHIFVNVFGESIEDFSMIASRIKGVSGLEVNVSCPNVTKGGDSFGRDPEMVFSITKAVCNETELPVIVKLTPSIDHIEETAHAAKEGGAIAVTAANTFPGLVIDIERKKPLFENITGGLSGPAVKPLALYNVYKIKNVVDIPIIGSGGITNYQDVIEYLIAGASAVQIGSIIFNNPLAPIEILDNLECWMKEKSYKNLSDINKK